MMSELAIQQMGLERLVVSPSRPEGVTLTPSREVLASVRQVGVVVPLVVRPTLVDRYEILSDPQVWVAAGRVGLSRVPVVIRDDLPESRVQRIVALHYTDGRRNPLLEAEEFAAEFAEQGHGDVSRLARRLGLRRSYVAHALRLLTLPEWIQEKVRAGGLTGGHARALVSVPDESRRQLVQEIELERLSVRATELRAKALRAADDRPIVDAADDPDIRRLQAEMTELIGSPFRLDGGKVVIDYFDDLDILQGILVRLGYIAK
ncbi:MAG: ParB/RepB/Spo0J family partition protein [Parvibaculaceae bacterium]